MMHLYAFTSHDSQGEWVSFVLLLSAMINIIFYLLLLLLFIIINVCYIGHLKESHHSIVKIVPTTRGEFLSLGDIPHPFVVSLVSTNIGSQPSLPN